MVYTASSPNTRVKAVSAVAFWAVVMFTNSTKRRMDSRSLGVSDQYLMITSNKTNMALQMPVFLGGYMQMSCFFSVFRWVHTSFMMSLKLIPRYVCDLSRAPNHKTHFQLLPLLHPPLVLLQEEQLLRISKK